MLNQNRVLNYIKSELGFPFIEIELEDEKILEHITEYTLREFSYFVPQVKKIGLNLDLEINKVPGRSNEFYLTDPEGIEILNVKEIYPKLSNHLIHGQPPIGPLSFGELKSWALDNEMAGMLKSFSSYDMTFEFTHPNIVRISSEMNNTGYVTVEYERMQPSDFSGVQNEYQWVFQDLALADIMIIIGRIRKKYSGRLSTIFGEIPLGDEILDEGKEKKREVLEKLNLGPTLNVIFDRG